jgi:adenylate cyclase
VNEAFFAELSEWLTQAGLAGMSETDIVSGFCDRCVEAGLPLARALMFIDTLHPVHEGRLFRWGYGPTESPLLEYGSLHRAPNPWMWSRPNAGGTVHTTRWCKLATRFCAAA